MVSALAYGLASFLPYPESYYSVENCALNQTSVNNPDAPNAGMKYVAIMALAVCGVGLTDLASGFSHFLVSNQTQGQKNLNSFYPQLSKFAIKKPRISKISLQVLFWSVFMKSQLLLPLI